jgi:Fic family protein
VTIQKLDTSNGFHPAVAATSDMVLHSTESLRRDGRLDSAILSPTIHQLILSIARLRNVVSSLRIEGEPVDLKMARQVIEHRKPQTPQEREVLLLSETYDQLHRLDRLPRLDVEYIRSLHARLFPDQIGLDSGPVGEFKDKPNGVFSESEQRWIFEATPPERTVVEIGSLLDWVDAEAWHLPPAVAAAVFFAEFQAIHPFSDGNGRVGRFLNLHLLRMLGYRNVCLVPLDGRFFRTRNRYYAALRTTNTGQNYQIWCRYFASQLDRAYKLALARADLRPLLEQFSRHSTRSMLEWCLAGDGGWFSRSDFPNPKHYSPPALTSSLGQLVKRGVLEQRGEKRGRQYRLSTEFMRRVYGRESILA